MNGSHVVIGAGEVGQAVTEILSGCYQTHLRDVEPSGPVSADVLHICFPWSSGFVGAVEAYREQYRPQLVIVHSTVPVGTCDALGVVHSPIRGKHPHLAESIRGFVKFFGGPGAFAAARHFEAAGVRCEVTPRAATTEAGKLWELTQYGLAIAIEKQIYEFCEVEGLDFDVIYTRFAETYNEGYQSLGDPQYTRPVLRHVPGPIGGHCVVPGSLLLGFSLAKLVSLAELIAQAGVSDAVEVEA